MKRASDPQQKLYFIVDWMINEWLGLLFLPSNSFVFVAKYTISHSNRKGFAEEKENIKTSHVTLN